MTLSSATAAGSAPKAGVNLECVEAGPSIPAPGSARHVAPALGAPLIAISNPNPKQTQHGNDRRFYRDLLRAPIGEPYFAPDMLAPDMLLALCHHASTHDLSESAISELLARPNSIGLPCLDVTNTSSILSAYYESLQERKTPSARGSTRARRRRHAKPGQQGVHIAARIVARVTLTRVTDVLTKLPALAFSGGGSPMHLRLLRDCLELKATAQDIILQRPTAERRCTREFAAAWRFDAPSLQRRVGWGGMVPTVDEVRTTQDLFTKYGSCTGVGTWMDDVGCADCIGGPDGYDRDYARRTTTFRLPLSTSPLRPLHPFYTTEHDFVWCLPPGPLWWEQALKEIRWTLYLAATEAAQQGGFLRILPPPKVRPDHLPLSHALDIDAEDGRALRRVRRMFLGWSAYEAIDDYETFGWWDLQGDGTHTDVVDAEAGFEPFDDATNYYGEEDCADAFDDEGFSARYFDQE